MKCGILILSLLLPTAALADWWLVTYNLDLRDDNGDFIPLDHERFVNRMDCRARGNKNIALIESMQGRGGYACFTAEEYADGH